MSQVAIEKVDEKKVAHASFFDELKEMSEKIRKHAFEIFERHPDENMSALEDWVKAERDLLMKPEAEMVETDGKFEIKMNAPGYDPDEIKVTALPDAVFVRAASTHSHEGTEGDVRFCEFGQKSLFRRFDFPEAIDLEKVTANLDKGVLNLTAVKAEKTVEAPKVLAAA
jgi:HSP20 family molecular chaperone IbpA